MPVSLPGVFNVQRFTDLGALAVGGRIYTYAPSTTTHKTAYTDQAGTVAHTYTSDGSGGQYIALNARGELPAPLFLSDGGYDIAYKTAAGVTVWTRRAIGAADDPQTALDELALAGGSALVSFLQSGAGALSRSVESKLRDFVSVKDFGALGNGVADDSASIAAADAAAALIGATLVFPAGTYVCNSATTFASRVLMAGGVLAGSGAASFSVDFEAAPYYCLDCPVAQIKTDVVRAEWFGARRSTATPTSTSTNVSSKAWNAWPAFITGAGFGTEHNYGDATFLAGSKPFVTGDTWDFIGIQRALWALGLVTTGTRGEVGLLGGVYYLTRAVRYVSDMASTLSGKGSTKTILNYADRATHSTQVFDSGTAKCLLTFFGAGPDPILVRDLGLIGPSGYSTGSDLLYLVAMESTNGVTFNGCWFSTGNDLVHLDRGSNDIWIKNSKFEYGVNQVRGYDATSWVQVSDCGLWKAGGSPVGVNVAGYAFIKGCTFVSHTTPWQLGRGSHVSSTTVIQNTTGYRTLVDGRTITRRMDVAGGATGVIATFAMAATGALQTKVSAGGVVQGVGSAGIYEGLTWATDAGLPSAASILTKARYGNVTARALVDLSTTTTSPSTFTLTLINTGTSGQTYSADVTVTVEGGDFILSAFN